MKKIFDLPFITGDVPGTGGFIKESPEDFLVEERPLYEPSGSGEHLFVWIEKRGISTFDAVRRIASVAGVSPRDVGYAGLKDVKAVARQMLSLPRGDEGKLRAMSSGELKVLDVKRSSTKLRTGHLKGNFFRIVIHDVEADAVERARAVLDILGKKGVPNFYGPQRFGSGGRNIAIGRALLKEDYRNVIKAMLAPSATEAGTGVYEARRLAWTGDFDRALRLFPESFVSERRLVIGLRDAGITLDNGKLSYKPRPAPVAPVAPAPGEAAAKAAPAPAPVAPAARAAKPAPVARAAKPAPVARAAKPAPAAKAATAAPAAQVPPAALSAEAPEAAPAGKAPRAPREGRGRGERGGVEAERAKSERAEAERLKRERIDAERKERQRGEDERKERERGEAALKAKERTEVERRAQERALVEEIERAQAQKEAESGPPKRGKRGAAAKIEMEREEAERARERIEAMFGEEVDFIEIEPGRRRAKPMDEASEDADFEDEASPYELFDESAPVGGETGETGETGAAEETAAAPEAGEGTGTGAEEAAEEKPKAKSRRRGGRRKRPTELHSRGGHRRGRRRGHGKQAGGEAGVEAGGEGVECGDGKESAEIDWSVEAAGEGGEGGEEGGHEGTQEGDFAEGGHEEGGAREWGGREGAKGAGGPEDEARTGTPSKRQLARIVRTIPRRYLEFYVAALQAHLFNQVLKTRYDSLDRVFVGDLAWIHEKECVFLVENAEAEAPRAAAFEISPSGPIFGYKVPYAKEAPGEIEWKVLKGAHLLPRNFRTRLGLKNKGVRRPMRVPITEVSLEPTADGKGLAVGFALPKGSYATTVLREIMKCQGWDALV